MDGVEEQKDCVQAQVIENSKHIDAILCYLYIAQYLHTCCAVLGLLPVTFCYLSTSVHMWEELWLQSYIAASPRFKSACRLASTRCESYLSHAPEVTAAMSKPFVDGCGEDVKEAYEDVRNDSSGNTW